MCLIINQTRGVLKTEILVGITFICNNVQKKGKSLKVVHLKLLTHGLCFIKSYNLPFFRTHRTVSALHLACVVKRWTFLLLNWCSLPKRRLRYKILEIYKKSFEKNYGIAQQAATNVPKKEDYGQDQKPAQRTVQYC